MNIRSLRQEELPALLRLYAFLNPDDPRLSPESPGVQGHWSSIFDHPLLHYYGAEKDGEIVSTCTLTLIPNMSRGMKPYGLIENVVTDPAFRNQGLGTAVLQHALAEAWGAGCYKVMLLSGRQDPATLRFYEKAGFKRGIKTAFDARPS